MADDLAAANVNRSYQLAASSIAIFTFLLFFLYPKFVSGEANPWSFQTALVVMGVAMAVFVVFTGILGWIRQYLVLHTGNRVDAVLGAIRDYSGTYAPGLALFTTAFVAGTIVLLELGNRWSRDWNEAAVRQAGVYSYRATLRGGVGRVPLDPA